MATKTGFIVFSTKQDLNEIFALRTSAAGPNTGYIKFSTGQDLSQIFEPYASGIKALTTGFKLADKVTDLCDVFKPMPMTFKLSNIGEISAGTSFVGYIWTCCCANNGIGYFSAFQNTGGASLLFKTTDNGANFSKINTSTLSGFRGIASNASNNMLVISCAGGQNSLYSTNGGSSFSEFGSNALLQGCIMTRNNVKNYVIQNVNNATKYSWSESNYATITTYSSLPSSNVTNGGSGANSISDVPNLFVTTLSGLNVYRNQNSGQITIPSTGTDTSVTITYADGSLTAKYVDTCCNANNTVNFIVNRTTTTGGKIYKSTAWNETFTEVLGSPVGLWVAIETSSAGNVVCAITDTLIYLSLDAGITWKNILFNYTLLSDEKFIRVSVSPDEKNILVSTSRALPYYGKILYYTL